ncbi:helix-turn-helix domain-containing protein [Phreatobacter oligotrophus]|jgi:transcriptional regulator with XRE-family HTH domain|uniref:XRE family transcriptional regulator n=1 Tax=Phreatobacter oligotrophus TaxID=1122261 RepID=A0A2T4YXV6_9HYPH|nr:XRE family transcriptional regulator [Phreatobacter oligotrophus]PTM51131.1 XRE family transcriptional regulator [Phreatobacter oligotrophus]
METAPAPDDLDQVVAQRVRELRAAKGLTLDQLAALSGVSRAMISRIERAEASATAVLLVKLGAALGVTLGTLFEKPQPKPDPVRRAATTAVRTDPETGYTRRNVAPPNASGTDIVEVMLPAGKRVAYDNIVVIPVEQFVWVLEGTLTLSYDGLVTDLGPGDCRVMRLDYPLVFENRTERPARYCVVLVPNTSGGLRR